MNLFDKVLKIMRDKIPLGRRTYFTHKPSTQGAQLANTLSVDKLHGILRAAERGDCSDLFDLYRDIVASDSHIQTEFAKRKIAVLSEIISAQPADKNNADDVNAAHIAQKMLDNIPQREEVLSALLDSTLWPFSLAEKVFRPSYKPGLRYELDRIIPVPYNLIDLREGDVRIFETDGDVITRSSYEAIPSRYILHKGNILTTPLYWGGPMRALLFWWLFSTMDLGWWAEFLEKYGTPFLIGRYDQNDDESRDVLSLAFSSVQRLGGLVITKETDIEVQNALNSQNGDSFEKFLAICNREKSKLILGQTLSAEAQPTGLGSGVANSHEAVRNDIKAFDCTMLARTLREQLVKPFLEFNGIKGAIPKVVIGNESEESTEALAQLLTSLSAAGLRPNNDAIEIISTKIGFGIERVQAASPLGFSANDLQAFSATLPTAKTATDATLHIAKNASAEVARRLSTSSAVVAKILETSTSAADFENKIKAFCAKWPDADITALIQDALNSNVLNIQER